MRGQTGLRKDFEIVNNGVGSGVGITIRRGGLDLDLFEKGLIVTSLILLQLLTF